MFAQIKKLLRFKQIINANKKARIEQLKNALVFLAIAGACYGFYLFSSNESDTSKTIEPPVFDGAFDKAFSRVSDEALIEKQQHQIDALKEMISKNENNLVNNRNPSDNETKSLVEALKEKLDKLEAENQKINEKLQVTLLKNAQASLVAVTPPTREEMEEHRLNRLQLEKERYLKAGLETVHFNYRRKNFREERTPDNYVWAGTFAEGVLLSGAKGDAGINGAKNMGTALIRLDSDGIMPNNKHSHLNGCFALVSTYGDLSEDAVVMHLETLSCIGKLNFEQKVYGAVFDLDAMQDLRGTSILKTKPLLNYTAAAGFLAGIGDGLKNYGTAQSINPQTGAITTYSTAANLAQSAGGGALSNPANRISDYIMKIADIYHPLVVARAGRRVSVMFSKGFWIDRKHQVYDSSEAIDNQEAKSEAGITTTVSRALSIPQSETMNPVHEENVYSAHSEPDEQVAQQFLKQTGVSSEPLFSNVSPKDATHG
ncbi:TrbI/VirB10 family protein [Legionella septentrionalis]|uniref:TrbI/VirB10 family protein n=1 Tax=Legionella septentrionalis TaxID=2498109 RepID=UPI000F8C9617|nr:TrbI/VirB10 family protein [Legionella septentrionalis]RUQ96650.1 conjugal transfer protein TraB [Legionella septentrionalis]